MIESDDIGEAMRSTETLKIVTQLTTQDSDLLDQRKSISSLTTEPNLPDESLCNIGKACLQSVLLTSVEFGSYDITAGLRAVIAVELFNDVGKKVPFAASLLTVRITDPDQQDLQVTFNTTRRECAMAFTPQRSGLHEISVLYLGQKLKCRHTHITVKSNNPVLKFGRRGYGKGGFKFPRGIKIGKDNCLYVADSGNRLIQKFTADGKFLNQFRVDVNGPNFSTFDMAVDEDEGRITCPEIQLRLPVHYDDHDGYEESFKGNKVLVFNLEGQLQDEYIHHKMKLPENITMNSYGDMIISDRKTNSFFKFDKAGKFICEMGNSEIPDGPSYMCIQADGGIIFSDTGNDCIRMCDSAGQLTHTIGTWGHGIGQLHLPYGVATDGENIVVVDHGGRIQVFKTDGTFVSIIESESEPLSGPRGLAVTQDGYVYVADRHNHCIKKYKYRDMSDQHTNKNSE